MHKQIFRLPDYVTITSSFKEYKREWDKIIKPLEKLTGLKCYGFDPDIALCNIHPDGNVGPGVSLPIWFVRRLLDGVKKVSRRCDCWREAQQCCDICSGSAKLQLFDQLFDEITKEAKTKKLSDKEKLKSIKDLLRD